MPNKTYHFKSQKCSGGKNSKVRLAGMTAGNAIGEKLPMFAIGKSKTPRCFKHKKNLPCKYKLQKKSWMDSQLFKEWVRKLERTFWMKVRKIALLIDNCPAKPPVSHLTNVQLVVLRLNTTSGLQPMDQGVIRSLKAHYRGRVAPRLCRALEKMKTLPKYLFFRRWKY